MNPYKALAGVMSRLLVRQHIRDMLCHDLASTETAINLGAPLRMGFWPTSDVRGLQGCKKRRW